jgi:4,5-dihydroxyphthalate decarboxylase
MSAATLRTVLKTYPHTQALKRGALTDRDVTLDFVDVAPVHKAFAPMVRETAYDLCELAIVTALQAIAYGTPIVLLPAVVASRFQRGCIVGWTGHGIPDPATLAGKRVAVRAYTQTTGMWVRAHLAEDAGLDLRQVEWVTQDPAHVAEFQDPPYVSHAPKDQSLSEMLQRGDVDAAIFGNDLPTEPGFAPLIPDADARDQAWWNKHGFMPINHMVAASRAACDAHPEAVRAAYRLLKEAAAPLAAHDGQPVPYRFGFTALRDPVAYTIEACLRQDLLPRALTVDEVFAPAMELLGHDGA